MSASEMSALDHEMERRADAILNVGVEGRRDAAVAALHTAPSGGQGLRLVLRAVGWVALMGCIGAAALLLIRDAIGL